MHDLAQPLARFGTTSAQKFIALAYFVNNFAWAHRSCAVRAKETMKKYGHIPATQPSAHTADGLRRCQETGAAAVIVCEYPHGTFPFLSTFNPYRHAYAHF